MRHKRSYTICINSSNTTTAKCKSKKMLASILEQKARNDYFHKCPPLNFQKSHLMTHFPELSFQQILCEMKTNHGNVKCRRTKVT
uniref:Uncharacterized protein n=1 Tax=Rhipicephalus appendiculatus TaxID=34631 RepID=A0A131YEK5_RHIAP